MNSIMQDEKVCYLTGATEGLHKHHVMRGKYRKKAEEWGCWVWLRADWHVGTDYCVHADHQLEMCLRRECQRQFEARWGHDKWMEVFGRNYL